MEAIVLNTNFQSTFVIDTFESIIWTDRYSECGDFEIYTLVSADLLDNLRQGYYLWINESEHLMIIEGIEIKSDVENGNRLIVTGRSLESILDRRIIIARTVLTGNLQNGIQTLLNSNIISPTITDRIVSNFVFEASVDPLITALTVDVQVDKGLNLYEVIQRLCISNNIGFKITLSSTNQFVFKLYAGADRSFAQLSNPYVIFSPNYENLINSSYSNTEKPFKNIVVVDGEGEGENLKTTTVGSGSGITRREFYLNASSISQTIDGVTLTDEEYLARLGEKGNETLIEHLVAKAFAGQVDTVSMFKYGTDFFMGDIIQISNEYGIESKARVTEMIYSESGSGIEAYPTFIML